MTRGPATGFLPTTAPRQGGKETRAGRPEGSPRSAGS